MDKNEEITQIPCRMFTTELEKSKASSGNEIIISDPVDFDPKDVWTSCSTSGLAEI